MSMPEKYVRPAVAVVAVGIALAVLRRRWAQSRPPYPPGPKGYPVIGNVLDLPKDPVWEGYAAMAKEHGEHQYHFSCFTTGLGYLTWMGCRYGNLTPGYDGFACSRAEQQ